MPPDHFQLVTEVHVVEFCNGPSKIRAAGVVLQKRLMMCDFDCAYLGMPRNLIESNA